MRIRFTATLLFALLAAGLLSAWATGAFAASSSAPRTASRIGAKPRTYYALGSTGCPTNDKHTSFNRKHSVKGKLVPPGAQSLVVCSYLGLNATKDTPAFGLLSVGSTGQKATARFIADLNALKPTKGTYNCPMDDGTAAVAQFQYASGRSYNVKVGMNGCNDITNGTLSRLGLGKPFIARIAKVANQSVAHGTVTGRTEICGGPAPGTCRVARMTGCSSGKTHCYTDNSVEFKTRAGVSLGRFPIKKGRFTVQLPAGKYRAFLIFTNTKTGKPRKGSNRGAGQLVKVKAHHITKLTFQISVP